MKALVCCRWKAGKYQCEKKKMKLLKIFMNHSSIRRQRELFLIGFTKGSGDSLDLLKIE